MAPAILALAFIIGGLWAIASAILAIFPKFRPNALRHLGVSALISVGALAYAIVAPDHWQQPAEKTDPSVADRSAPALPSGGAAQTAPIAQDPATNWSQASSAAPVNAPSRPPLSAEEAYVKELRDHMGLMKITAAGKFGGSLDSVQFVLGQIERWATLYRQGTADFTLVGNDEKVRREFKTALANMQATVFPMLRDKYGPAAREKLWIANGSARTFGSGYRTVEFVAGAFVLNRNIAEVHEKAIPLLRKLRFTAAIYRWAEGQSGTQFKIAPPPDRAIGTWNGAEFVEVD